LAPFSPQAGGARNADEEVTETEAYLWLKANTAFLPKERRSDKAVAAATEALKEPLKVLDAGRQYLLGSDFTIADLNVASVLSHGMLLERNLSATPAAHAWFKRCLSRPAVAKVHAFK
jgi:glutathione S-transferase